MQTDENLNITFYRAPHNEYTLDGEFVSAEMKDWVKVITPGDDTYVLDTLAEDYHKEKYPKQWQAYLANETMQGTPIESWPDLSPDMIVTFKGQGFNYIEQVEKAGDNQLAKIMGGTSWRKKAADYLDSIAIKESDIVKDLQKQNEALQKQFDELKALVEKPKLVGAALAAHEAKLAKEAS